MNKNYVRSGALLAGLSITVTAFAGGTTPIRSDRDALRSALSGYLTSIAAPQHMDQITMNARYVVREALTGCSP